MIEQQFCPTCRQAVPLHVQVCPNCGKRIPGASLYAERSKETLNIRILYIMVGLLILAVLCPPWEAGPGEPPAYLGMHFIQSPPEPGAVISKMLQSIELVTIAVGGMYLAWLFREKPK
jgi:hypothetical protein